MMLSKEPFSGEVEHETLTEPIASGQVIQETTAPDVDAVVRLFSDKRLRTRKGSMVGLWLASAPVTALLALGNFLNGEPIWAMVSAFFLATALQLNRLAAEVDQIQVVLQTNLDKSWVGALVDALEWPNKRIRSIARASLTRLLPTLTEADAPLLDDAQRASLYSRLSPRAAVKNAPLTFAILKALEKVGDAEAVAPVTRLARMFACVSRQIMVQQAALECLPVLEKRVLEQRLAAPLLETQALLPIETETVSTSEQRQMDAQVQERLKALEAEARKSQPGMRLGFLFASYGIILPYTLYQTYLGFLHNHGLQMTIFGLMAIGTTQMHRLTLNAKHRAMAKFLAEQDSVQAIGPLAEALEWPDAYIRHVAIKALTQLLPQLRASDSSLLTPRQRIALYRMLSMKHARTHSTFLVTLLKALEQVGDQTVVPYVESLANSTPYTSQQQKVRDAAVNCLPFIKEQAKQDQYSQTLLRAASIEDVPAEHLLRPAFGTACTETAYLLRADAGENREGV